jgi:hypothetical protein
MTEYIFTAAPSVFTLIIQGRHVILVQAINIGVLAQFMNIFAGILLLPPGREVYAFNK